MKQEKRIKREIKKLVKQKQYEAIYKEYGPKYFRKYVSESYKQEDINNLREKGDYLQIYEKYGKLDLETKIKQRRESQGKEMHTKNGTISKLMTGIKTALGGIVGIVGSVLVAQTTLMLEEPVRTDIEINKNKNLYKELIEEYDETIKEYAKEFDTSKQSDFEIVMTCIYDLHHNIQGYANPELDIVRF